VSLTHFQEAENYYQYFQDLADENPPPAPTTVPARVTTLMSPLAQDPQPTTGQDYQDQSNRAYPPPPTQYQELPALTENPGVQTCDEVSLSDEVGFFFLGQEPSTNDPLDFGNGRIDNVKFVFCWPAELVPVMYREQASASERHKCQLISKWLFWAT